MSVHRPPSRRLPLVLVVTAALVVLQALAPAGASALVPTTPDKGLWQPNGRIRAILQTASAIYVAGSFTALTDPATGSTVSRQGLAALDPSSGAPLPLDLPVDKTVWRLALSPDGSRLYLGGDFLTVGGQSRKKVAAVNLATGSLASWNPGANNRVEAIEVRQGTVYLGGLFTAVGGVPRSRLAAVSASTGVPTSWAPSADATVHDLTLSFDGTRLLAGGAFSVVNGSSGTSQRRLASLDPVTGALQPWAVHPGYEVFDVEAGRTQTFASAGGAGGHLVAFDNDGNQQWMSLTDGDVVDAKLQNGVLYVGGHFTTYQGAAASHLAAVDPTTGAQLALPVRFNSNLGVHTMDAFQGHLMVGGDFTRVNGRVGYAHIARFSEAVDTTPPTAPGRPSATSVTASSIGLIWAASTDTAATLVYRVYRDDTGAVVGSVSAPPGVGPLTFTDSSVQPGSTYVYTVVADDGTNLSAPSPASVPISTVTSASPVLRSLVAQDTDTDGKVDTVVATFSSTVSCTAPCLRPWTLSAFPSGASLSSVTVSGTTAILRLTESPSVVRTDVGNATVALAADPAGVVGGDGTPSSFAATAPADGMGPVPVSVTSADVGGQPGVMQPGDTVSVTFSEPLDPASLIAANVKAIDPKGDGDDSLIIVGLSANAMDLGGADLVAPDGGTIVYQSSTLTLVNGRRTVVSTLVGDCTGTACGSPGAGGTATLTFVPDPVVRDPAGNSATGATTASTVLY